MVLKRALNALTLLWYTSVLLVIFIGWLVSDQRYLVPESGIGYWLGILGGSMMLLLLVYPVRKKKSRWSYAGSIKFWFRLHMFLGIVGPVLIIFHSGYQLGSLNGRVALISMLVVACSGLVGRYFYQSIHHGLYGEKIKFEELYRQDENVEKQFAGLRQIQPDVVEDFQKLGQELADRRQMTINRSLLFYLSRRWRLRQLRARGQKITKLPTERKILLKSISGLRTICNFGINEIMFSYWHVLHFPIFIMLIISGLIHVVVVHFY